MGLNTKRERKIILALAKKKKLSELKNIESQRLSDITYRHYRHYPLGQHVQDWEAALLLDPIQVVRLVSMEGLYICRKSTLISYVKKHNLILPYDEDSYPDIFVIGTKACILTDLRGEYFLHGFFGVFEPMTLDQFLYKMQVRLRNEFNRYIQVDNGWRKC